MEPPDGGDGQAETRPAPALSLRLTLDAGERISGTVGVLGAGDGQAFHGWVDLISTIEALRASAARE